ncbi:MAG: CDP-diacylglycerol--glycerol-3-phosphate 3-phosphatidyltransferase [Euryarchaeota archaeon]|nr:CDP-diacylglycerol--glycerol-3-phosphate 3-phosphatidyltransferase [Euryarchaeota archaeon]|tara:strand:+ start:4245 stop:4922 length:678 start_codon:yes stop_codon:yes gene_type:complete
MFEKFRETWTKTTEPIVVKMGNLDPSILTWTSLVIAIVAFVLLAEAQFDETGGLMIIGGIVLIIVAGIFDALDGALARHQGTDGPYGDFLDHTIDRVVDVGLLVALGMNAAFVDDMSSGSMAALLTLMGSYMGTQAQSVGLGRIYGGFSRADRLVITMIGLLAAAIQAITDTVGISSDSIHEYFDWIILGNSELNGITFAIAFSAWGGVYTFIIRFLKTRKGLLG